MNSFKQSLADIVRAYTQYNVSNKSYDSKQLPASELQKIEVQLITLFSQFLTSKGVEETQIDRQQKILVLHFHPDKLALDSALPEVKWLENSLSGGRNNGVCFNLIRTCAEELKQPQYTEEDNFIPKQDDLNDLYIDKLIIYLKEKRGLATTITQKALIDSTIILLQNIKLFQTTTDKLDPGWLKTILKSLPYITSGFCVGLYLKELSLLYAVLFTLTKGGNWLKKGDVSGWRELGEITCEFSKMISNAATTLMLHFININFSAVNTTYYIGFTACSKIYQLLGFSEKKQIPAEYTKVNTLALTLLPQAFLPGKLNFTTLELKLIALRLEQYQHLQQQQYFATWRRGSKKSYLIEQALQELNSIDLKPISIKEKLMSAQVIIDRLAHHAYFKEAKSRAKETIDAVKVILQSLMANYNDKESNDKLTPVDECETMDGLYMSYGFP
ncbi:hypothetical protein ACNVED_03640 [Legionella sp. D16C41]|uniref:hypothetical protein n=1 Tax=Legionella sp. D16C41 TaxID=3402688 RepID=UPI003AF8AC4E